jgi:flagellar motor switch protein FliN/FliY
MANETPPADAAAVSPQTNSASVAEAAAAATGENAAPPGAQEVDAAVAAAVAATSKQAAPSASDASDGGSGVDQTAIDELLQQANFEDPATMDGGVPEAGAAEFKLPDFQQVMQDAQASSIDLLRDVDLNVKIELGRARMLVEEVLKLGEGSVVELDKLAGDPVDIFVNDRLVARGEVLVLNDNFCVRINEIVAGIKEEGG